MSGTHSHTAKARADLARSDVQDRKPNTPPGHVEADRPIRRLSMGQSMPVVGVVLAVVAVVAVLFLLIA